MRLTTRCPACQTTFRVVPDQLRLADGWVRCGRCSTVFEAQTTELQEPEASASADTADSTPQATPHSTADLPALDMTADGPPSSFPPSFVRRARSDAYWARPGVRLALAGGCVLAALGLALQVVVHQRDRLAASRPELMPMLQALCEPLRCSVAPLKRIDAVVIDASGLTRLRDDAYRLQVALNNKAATEVAMPAIELTLTDAADRPVLRRVVLPSEWGAKAALPPARQVTAQFVFSIAGVTGVAGYRVLAFHP